MGPGNDKGDSEEDGDEDADEEPQTPQRSAIIGTVWASQGVQLEGNGSEDEGEGTEEDAPEDSNSEDFDPDAPIRLNSVPHDIMADDHMARGGELHTPQRSAVLGVTWFSQQRDPDFSLDKALHTLEAAFRIPNFSAMEVLNSNRARRWDTDEEYQESMRETLRGILRGEGRVGRVSGKREVTVDAFMKGKFLELVMEDERYGEAFGYERVFYEDEDGVPLPRVSFGLVEDESGMSGCEEDDTEEEESGMSGSEEDDTEEGEDDDAEEISDAEEELGREPSPSPRRAATEVSPSRKRQASVTDDGASDVTPERTKRAKATGGLVNVA